MVRSGFKKGWGECDHEGILNITHKIRENVVEKDSRLLTWYDQTLARTERD